MIPNMNTELRAIYVRPATYPSGADQGHDEFAFPIVAWSSDGFPLVLDGTRGRLVPAADLDLDGFTYDHVTNAIDVTIVGPDSEQVAP